MFSWISGAQMFCWIVMLLNEYFSYRCVSMTLRHSDWEFSELFHLSFGVC